MNLGGILPHLTNARITDLSQMKMTKQVFLTDFFNYKFLCVNIVANTKKIWWGHID